MMQLGREYGTVSRWSLRRNNLLVELGSDYHLLPLVTSSPYQGAEAHSMVLGAARPTARRSWMRGKLAFSLGNSKNKRRTREKVVMVVRKAFPFKYYYDYPCTLSP